MVNKAEIKRRKAQSQRDKAKHRRERIGLGRWQTQSRGNGIRNAELWTSYVTDPPLEVPPTTDPIAAQPELLDQTMEMENTQTDFIGSIARMFNDQKYSDIEISIHGVTLYAHQLVVCLQSPYFENAFQKGFAEGTSRVLTFKEGSGAAYWRVFEFLYTGDYSETLSNKDLKEDYELLKDPRVYILADMFLLGNLKALATVKFRQKLENLSISDGFFECVREIYASTYEGDCELRSAVVETAVSRIREMAEEEKFRDLIREVPDFAIAYIEKLQQRLLRFQDRNRMGW